MEPGLKGLRTAVTGDAAGRGRAMADHLAGAGAHVAYCTLHAGDAAAAVQALSEHGTHVTVTTIPLHNGAALARWVRTAAQDFGGLDLVVCSLGEAPAEAALQLLQAARPHLLHSATKAFVAVADDAALHATLATEAEGLQLQALPAGPSAADWLAGLRPRT